MEHKELVDLDAILANQQLNEEDKDGKTLYLEVGMKLSDMNPNREFIEVVITDGPTKIIWIRFNLLKFI